MLNKRIGMIGAGQMALALAAGFVRKGLVPPEYILASDPLENARQRFQEVTGARVTDNNLEVVRTQDIIILAIKPQVISKVFEELQGRISPEKLVISIVAGVTLETLQRALGENARIIRAMPNTPALVGSGITAYAVGKNIQPADVQTVEAILSAVGVAVQVEERLMNAVTAVSGSGPAFVYLFIEALVDAGVRHGLPRELARQLVVHTVRGASEMVIQSGEHPALLRDRVTSPGGTTIAGLAALETNGFRGAVFAAIEAAVQRAEELSRGSR
ncbi:MAG TPA: pyrroline-5-carboxylate reductase [Thermogutta sp.]|nr:pyrroline-5-carboxylate reductase [Thermogutta sp.]